MTICLRRTLRKLKRKISTAYKHWRMSPEERYLSESTNLSELEQRMREMFYPNHHNHKGGLL